MGAAHRRARRASRSQGPAKRSVAHQRSLSRALDQQFFQPGLSLLPGGCTIMAPYPKVDSRTASVLANQARLLLRRYVPELQTGEEAGQLSDALINIFARYGELLIARLNRVPEKYLLAFLDLIGISPEPPQA